uniref:ERAP1_C domain-containing protein n=1 Tax=Rhodnius prolixus TaxID=13249 RepID=T1I5W0_RHOPR
MKRDGYINTYAIQQFSHEVTFNDINRVLVFQKSVAIMRMVFFHNINKLRSILYDCFIKKTKVNSLIFFKLAKKKLNFDPEPVFETFLHQKGYPLLNVSSLYGTSHIIERISYVNSKYHQRSTAESIYGYNWDIPIYYICETNPKAVRFVLMKRNQTKVSLVCPAGKWIIINHKHAGYYRVNYSQVKWTTFAYVFMTTPEILEPENRAGLIEDAFCLAKAGYFHYNIPFNLTVYLHFYREHHCYPWQIISKNLHELSYHLMDTTCIGPFMLYVRSLIGTSMDTNLWSIEDDSHMEKLAKMEILNLGGWSGEPKILAAAKGCFYTWFEHEEIFAPDLMIIILRYGLHSENNTEMWNKVLKSFAALHNCRRKDECWTALSSARDSQLIEKLIQTEKMENYFQSEIMHKRLNTLLDNNYAIQPLWNFMRFLILIKEYMKLQEKSSALERVIESISINIKWKDAYYEVLCEWLHLYVTNVCVEEESEE